MIATRTSAGQCSPFPCLIILSPPSKWIWTKWCGGLGGGEASCGTRTGLEIHRLEPYSPLWTAWESCEQTHWFRQIHTHSPIKHTRHVDSVAAEEELVMRFCRLLSNLSGEWQMSCVKTRSVDFITLYNTSLSSSVFMWRFWWLEGAALSVAQRERKRWRGKRGIGCSPKQQLTNRKYMKKMIVLISVKLCTCTLYSLIR